MSDSYKHSYIVGENLLNSLSVYNVGYQKCDPEYQWGPGVRDHYCIHHIFSGSGSYMIGEKQIRLKEGDTFILYPGVEVRYCADREKPWEYGWAGFMGTDAASIIRNTDFTKKIPYIPAGKIPDRKIREGLQKIYDVKGNTYEAAVAMTGALYSFLAVLMHYHESEVTERDARMIFVEKAYNYIESNYVGISRSHLFRSFQTYMNCSPKEFLSQYRIKQACRLLKETDLSVSAIAYSVGFENNLYFSKAFRKQKQISPTLYREKHRNYTGSGTGMERRAD